MSKVANEETVEALLSPMMERLADNDQTRLAMDSALVKKAGVVVNPEHPIVVITDSIIKVAREVNVSSVAIDDIDEALEQTTSFLKSAGALTTHVKKAVGHKGKVPSGLRQRFPRS
jgi:hypothetical protein